MRALAITALAAASIDHHVNAMSNSAKKIKSDAMQKVKEQIDDIAPFLKQAVMEVAKNYDYETVAAKVEMTRSGHCPDGNCQTGSLDLSALHGYGCWCFFGNVDSALGRGPPVDAYDSICQKMSLCYRCIFADAVEESDDECDPFTVEFDASLTMSGGLGLNNATSSCQTKNQSNCAWRTCSCAMTMITSFFNLSFDTSNVYDDNLKHSHGFDYNLECPQQGKATDRQCCGNYPSRRTYDRGTARDCCHETTIYNPLRHICCPDGSHVGLGGRC